MHKYIAVAPSDVPIQTKQNSLKCDYTRKLYFEVHYPEHIILLDKAAHRKHFNAFHTLTKIQFYKSVSLASFYCKNHAHRPVT